MTDTKTTRSEQLFFDDPAIDRMMGVVMALATEHYVLRDRVRALEGELVSKGTVAAGALDRVPDGDREAAQAEVEAFAKALLEPLLGQQQSQGVTGRFSLKGKSGDVDHG